MHVLNRHFSQEEDVGGASVVSDSSNTERWHLAVHRESRLVHEVFWCEMNLSY